jgi:hypothetical protein
MTRPIRESNDFVYYEEFFNKYTAIMRRSDLELTDWNTGSDAEEEKEFLITCTDEQFKSYCENKFN